MSVERGTLNEERRLRSLGLLRWLETLSANNVGILDILIFLVILDVVQSDASQRSA